MSRAAIPTLETKRLRLRSWRDDDLQPFAAFERDPEAMRYIGTGDAQTEAQTAATIAGYLDEWQRTGCGRWAVELLETGEFIGGCGLVMFREGTPEAEPEVAYMVGRAWWGRGLGREAAVAAIHWGFARLGHGTVVGNTHPDNIRSQRILRSVGMNYVEDWEPPGRKLRLFRATRAQFERAILLRPG